MYKKGKNKNKDFVIFKGKKKEFFLGTLFNFLILGLFSFSIGCSDDGKFNLSSQAPHLSSAIYPLENSGADAEYSALSRGNTIANVNANQKLMPIQGKLGLSSLSPALDLKSIQSPFTLLQEADQESHLNGVNQGCSLPAYNEIHEIIQKDLGGAVGNDAVTANSLTYATGAYIASQFLECTKLVEFIGALYSTAEVTQVDDRDVSKIERESDNSDRPENGYKISNLAQWIVDSDTGMIQSKMLFSQVDNPFVDPKDSTKNIYQTGKEGIQIFSPSPDDENVSFDKWVYFINLIRRVKAASETNAETELGKPSSVDMAERAFLLEWTEEIASGDEATEGDEEAEVAKKEQKYHIVGSIRFQYNQTMFTIGKFAENAGGMVYQVKQGEKLRFNPQRNPINKVNYNRACTLGTIDKKYYNAEGEDVSDDTDALNKLKEVLGADDENTVAKLMERLPNFEDFNLENNAAITDCGFPEAEITKMHSEDISFINL